jgi:hypothetical protein
MALRESVDINQPDRVISQSRDVTDIAIMSKDGDEQTPAYWRNYKPYGLLRVNEERITYKWYALSKTAAEYLVLAYAGLGVIEMTMTSEILQSYTVTLTETQKYYSWGGAITTTTTTTEEPEPEEE